MDEEKRTIKDAIRDLAWIARQDGKKLEEEVKGAVSVNENIIGERNRINLAKIMNDKEETGEAAEGKKEQMRNFLFLTEDDAQ